MTEPSPDKPRRLTLPLILSALALASSALLWLGQSAQRTTDATRAEELAGLQRRLATMEESIQRERDVLTRLGQIVGAEDAAEDTLSERLGKVEDALAQVPGAGQAARLGWLTAQAEYYMRLANAQESLAGDPAGALTALQLADEYLRDAADPRLTGVRKLLAEEMTTLRNLPIVDIEGLVLKLGTLADSIESLPRKQAVPESFSPTAATPDAELRGWDRAVESVRNALLSIVTVRRADAPVSPLMTDESIALLIRSLELELQMARLALLRGQTPLLKGSLERVKLSLEKYFDTSTPAGANALSLVTDLASAPAPATLPDISGSLSALLAVEGRERSP
jgi:uroporphyrin-3 C-methyltransferase